MCVTSGVVEGERGWAVTPVMVGRVVGLYLWSPISSSTLGGLEWPQAGVSALEVAKDAATGCQPLSLC